MKITTNSFGNYKPTLTNQINKAVQLQSKQKDTSIKITPEEKKFFTQLYPNNEEQISNYDFYNKDGGKSSFSVGSLFDKRG